MVLIWLTGVLGLLIGSFLNVVIWRVPRGDSILTPSRCPNCRAAVKPWQNVPIISWVLLRGRCANCKHRISVRYPLIELATGTAFALVTWWWVSITDLDEMVEAFFGLQPPSSEWGAEWLWQLSGLKIGLVALLWFAAITIALTVIDIEHKRLPDRIVLTSLVVIVLLLALAAVLSVMSGAPGLTWGGCFLPLMLRTIGGAAALFVFYFIIAFIYPAGMGGGDVKLAPTIGAVLGFFAGWYALIIGAFAGFVLGAVWGLALMLMRKAGRKTAIPFGPFMLAGAWLGLIFGNDIMGWYLQVAGLAATI